MVSVFNFAHVSCLFLAKNYSKLNKGRDVHNKNFSNLVLESRCECNHPDKVIFNYSLYKTAWNVSEYGVISGPYFWLVFLARLSRSEVAGIREKTISKRFKPRIPNNKT